MSRFKRACSCILALILVFTIILNEGLSVYAAQEDPVKQLQKMIQGVSKPEALKLADKYYKLTYLKVESDLAGEFKKAVTKQPIFDGKSTDPKLADKNVNDVAFLINYTDAKNFYLAFAAANFSYDPARVNVASDLAAAIATYYDDLFYSSMGNTDKEKEFYADAVKLYSYALSLGIKDGKFRKECLPAMTSLGNLFLDMKKLEDAYTTFKAALATDNTFWPARQGLYNYYMAKGDLKKALEIIAEDAKYYPAMAKSVKDITKKLEEATKETGVQGAEPTDAANEQKLDKLSTVSAVTSGDFAKYIDPVAAAKIKKDIESMQSNLRFTAPDISFMTQYSSYATASSQGGRAAYETLANAIKEYELNTTGKTHEVTINNQLDMLEQFGVDIESDFGMENIEELINDAIANPEKYENYQPNIKITGISGIGDKANEYAESMNNAIEKATVKGDSEDVYWQLSKTRPEYKIMLVNPYKYNNFNDLLLQRFNVLLLNEKRNSYQGYLGSQTVKVGSVINEITAQYRSKIEPIAMKYENRIKAIEESEMSEDEKEVALHRVHVEFFPKFNNTGEPYWGQATQMACMAYKKIEKYSAQMYNDCMKHITLISDPAVREKLENEVRVEAINAAKLGMHNVFTAYGFAPYMNIAECDCDPERLEQLNKRIHEQANELIKLKIKAKKNFDDGILDENTKYYKDFIEKYECNVDYIIFKAKFSPYKSYTQFKLEAFNTGIFKNTATNHIKNTTTSESGLSVGLEEGAVGAKGYINFRSTTNGKGVTVSDTTIGLETSAGYGPGSLQANMEYNTVRGTRVYTKAGISGDPYLDKLKVEALGNEVWKPNIKLPEWNYSYDTGWSDDTQNK